MFEINKLINDLSESEQCRAERLIIGHCRAALKDPKTVTLIGVYRVLSLPLLANLFRNWSGMDQQSRDETCAGVQRDLPTKAEL